jgi:hypothetical protein
LPITRLASAKATIIVRAAIASANSMPRTAVCWLERSSPPVYAVAMPNPREKNASVVASSVSPRSKLVSMSPAATIWS